MCFTGFVVEVQELPLPCVFTAFAAEALPLPCVFTAFVNMTLPLPVRSSQCDSVADLRSIISEGVRNRRVASHALNKVKRPVISYESCNSAPFLRLLVSSCRIVGHFLGLVPQPLDLHDRHGDHRAERCAQARFHRLPLTFHCLLNAFY